MLLAVLAWSGFARLAGPLTRLPDSCVWYRVASASRQTNPILEGAPMRHAKIIVRTYTVVTFRALPLLTALRLRHAGDSSPGSGCFRRTLFD
jgi:hypothetical protein